MFKGQEKVIPPPLQWSFFPGVFYFLFNVMLLKHRDTVRLNIVHYRCLGPTPQPFPVIQVPNPNLSCPYPGMGELPAKIPLWRGVEMVGGRRQDGMCAGALSPWPMINCPLKLQL